MSDKPIGEMSFEEAMAALEQVVGALEKGDVPLEQSIALYERGRGAEGALRGKLTRCRGEGGTDPRRRKAAPWARPRRRGCELSEAALAGAAAAVQARLDAALAGRADLPLIHAMRYAVLRRQAAARVSGAGRRADAGRGRGARGQCGGGGRGAARLFAGA